MLMITINGAVFVLHSPIMRKYCEVCFEICIYVVASTVSIVRGRDPEFKRGVRNLNYTAI